MNNKLLDIKDLKVNIDDKEILKGLDLEIDNGETHIIMGPNGGGKSTLAYTLMGHPEYKITDGNIELYGENINELSADKRAKKGIFLSFQYPEEISGVTVEDFLRTAKTSISGETQRIIPFKKLLKEKMDELDMNEEYASRYLNLGFSGGEKKKSELLQMKFLNPKLIILDEIDSGLDIDAIRSVCASLKELLTEDKAVIIITHREEVIRELNVTHVHVLRNGENIKTGNIELFNEINKKGYSDILKGND